MPEIARFFGIVIFNTEGVNDIAKAITDSGLLPQEAIRDAIHIAVSCVHNIDILLTWNCRHIANAAIMKELVAMPLVQQPSSCSQGKKATHLGGLLCG